MLGFPLLGLHVILVIYVCRSQLITASSTEDIILVHHSSHEHWIEVIPDLIDLNCIIIPILYPRRGICANDNFRIVCHATATTLPFKVKRRSMSVHWQLFALVTTVIENRHNWRCSSKAYEITLAETRHRIHNYVTCCGFRFLSQGSSRHPRQTHHACCTTPWHGHGKVSCLNRTKRLYTQLKVTGKFIYLILSVLVSDNFEIEKTAVSVS